MKHIYFTGMMGSGKSTLGKLLAQKRKMNFVDLDEFIENQQKMTISQIFSFYGENHFRDLETNALREVSQYQQSHTIATGGGVVERQENRELMRVTGTILYLNVDIETLISRLENTTHRPLLANMNTESLRSKLEFLLQKRKAFYLENALVIIPDQNYVITIQNIQRTLQKMNEITIDIQRTSQQYNIIIEDNILSQNNHLLDSFCKGKKIVVIADEEAYSHHGPTLQKLLPENDHHTYKVKAPEKSKNLAEIEKITTWALERNIDRHTITICFGGGAVGDLGGFWSSIFMRGIPFIQVPTTLLAQVDASVGGKTGVNTSQGKNLIGAFYHPEQVFIDPMLLATLPHSEFLSGLAECIKAAVIGDSVLFDLLETATEWSSSMPQLREIILRSVLVKKTIVEQDEQEKNIRMLLNLGHTTGHALEAITHFNKYLHGEAVAFGSIVATIIAEKRSICSRQDSLRIQSLFRKILPNNIYSLPIDDILHAMKYDKKKKHDTLHFVLPEKIGKTNIFTDVNIHEIKEAIQQATQDA